MSDSLDIRDRELEGWASAQLPDSQTPPLPPPSRKMHLLVGDSIADDANLALWEPELVLNGCVRGATWRSIRRDLHSAEGVLDAWERASRSFRLTPGQIVVWVTGNDVYPRPGTGSWSREVERCSIQDAGEAAAEVAGILAGQAAGVVILGPLPRPRFDEGKKWETTAAFHLERRLKDVLRDSGVTFVPLGALLTKRSRNRRIISAADEHAAWWRADGIHLSVAGYRRVASRWPSWLAVAPERDLERDLEAVEFQCL